MVTPWKRLGPWLPGGTPPDDGDAALGALASVAEARRLLDRAELTAVRTARRAGRSWTEIATMLAVTRQSAWERWRDLDDAAPAPPAAPPPPAPVASAGRTTPRRRRMVTVPDVTGFTVAEALGILTGLGLAAESATPDIELFDPPGTSRPAVVVRQYPDSGTRVVTTTTVRLWLERGDGEAGVREPRRPSPPPRSATAEYDDAAAEAVG